MIARLIVRHFSFSANEQKLNSCPSLKWKFNFNTRLFHFEIVNYEWTSKMLLFFSQSWSWDNCYSNIFGVKIYSLLCNFFSYLTLWLRNSVDFRSLHRSCCFSVASLVGEFQWSAKFLVLIIPTRCAVPCNRRLRQFNSYFWKHPLFQKLSQTRTTMARSPYSYLLACS